MPFTTGRDLKEDILFRAGESATIIGWNSKAVDYLNRAYRALCAGASEYLPEFVDDWWWMRDTGTLILDPPQTGSVAVTKGSANITFAIGPTDSMVGRRLRIISHPDLFQVLTHTAGAAAAVLDTVYTGDTNAAAEYLAMKTEYALSSSVSFLISPMMAYREVNQIIGMTPERMDQIFPLSRLQTGAPIAFALENIRTVRFSHGGLRDGRSMRVDYRFKPTVSDLVDSPSSIPLVPLEFRHLLSDMALTYLFVDKNDDRAAASSASARSGLAAMVRMNRRNITKIDPRAGHIYARQGYRIDQLRPLRTESGHIIG